MKNQHGPVRLHRVIVVITLLLTSAPFASATSPLPGADQVKPELVATGLEFAEGPALDSSGNLFLVNYMGLGKIGQIAPDHTAAVFCDLQKLVPSPEGRRPTQANGLKIDSAGRLIASDCTGGRLLRIAADGKSAEVLANSFNGEKFRGINDVALDLAGNIYFSDPTGSNGKNPIGAIYRFDAKTGKVSQLDTGLAFPNGLAVTPDQRHLCLAESDRHRVLIYDLTDSGEAKNKRVLTDFTAAQEGYVSRKAIPDGMVFDTDGRLYVAMWTCGTINVIEIPSGKIVRQYDAGGGKATNCHFHDGCLYTTSAAKQAAFRLRLNTEGFDYNGQ
jgi:gluconolactonase